jgi:hypothetical protein
VKTFNQYLGAGVGFRIEQLVRMAVTAEKTLQPQHIAVFGATQKNWSADRSFQDSHTSQDQSAHDALAELGFRNHERAQALRGDDERLYGLLRCGVHQRRTARQ